MPTTADIEHLLRRTEYVARPERVAELVAKPSLAAAVDDILAVPTNPGTTSFTEATDAARSSEYVHFWLDRMAHDSPRPLQEKMAFFWHGHFCSSMKKVPVADLMREQIDLFRRDGLGNFRDLAIAMSTQVAMLLYLDNNHNRASSPNQNFARELLELFLLGVGNYTEADVEAGTAAWTGHTFETATRAYVWRDDYHDPAPKQYLGKQINVGGDWRQHGPETIGVVLGAGTVPAAAPVTANRGRPTREVAAEFVSAKMWAEFAGTAPPPSVITAMRDAALVGDFELRPWVRTMLLHPEFYTDAVKRGRVRAPVEYLVACLVATGLHSEVATPIWLTEGMGQRPLYPPDVSGWKHNDYWLNSTAMLARGAAANRIAGKTMTTLGDDGLIRLGAGTVTLDQLKTMGGAALVDLLLARMRISLAPSARDPLVDYANGSTWWERMDLVHLIMLTPDFQVG